MRREVREMFRRIIALSTLVSLLSGFGPAVAAPPITLPASDSASVVALGQARDPGTGELVEGYAIIHKKRGSHRPGHKNGGGTAKCYGFLANGAKWKVVEPWLVNPSNTRGLLGDFVLSNLSADITKWEDAAEGVLGNGASLDILGNGTSTNTTLVADTNSPDNRNEVYFADISQPGAIAVTIVWGIFLGPISNRKLVEWDQVYDDIDFNWSATGEAGKMDFENIATHELGHSVGMDDIYESVCSEVTMFGFAADGETKKRSLEVQDVTGVSTLY